MMIDQRVHRALAQRIVAVSVALTALTSGACLRSGFAPVDADAASGPSDASILRVDASLFDAAQPDTAQPDTAQPDSVQPDAAQPDGPRPDAGGVDAAELDAGFGCTPHCTISSCGGPDGCGGSCPITDCTSAGQVYYSVGQNLDDHKTGASRVQIVGGVAIFAEPQTAANLGVGDRVTLFGGSYVFISGKISSTEWRVVTATGGVPANTEPLVLDSIRHEFDSLQAAIDGAGDASHIGSFDLPDADVVLNISCYNDSGPEQGPATIDGYITDATRFVRVYTPFDTARECNRRQRHHGRWTATAYALVGPVTVEWAGILNVHDAHVRLEGLQLKETTSDPLLGGYAVITARENNIGNTAPIDLRLSHSLLWNAGDAPGNGRGLYLTTDALAGGRAFIWNNIIHASPSTDSGLRCSDTVLQIFFFNNTVAGYTGAGDQSENETPRLFKNNLMMGTATGTYKPGYLPGSDCNWSGDDSSTGGPNDLYDGHASWAPVTFVDEASGDFHLAPSDVGVSGLGADLSSDPNIAFTTDIDGQLRAGSWDIGADQRSDEGT